MLRRGYLIVPFSIFSSGRLSNRGPSTRFFGLLQNLLGFDEKKMADIRGHLQPKMGTYSWKLTTKKQSATNLHKFFSCWDRIMTSRWHFNAKILSQSFCLTPKTPRWCLFDSFRFETQYLDDFLQPIRGYFCSFENFRKMVVIQKAMWPKWGLILWRYPAEGVIRHNSSCKIPRPLDFLAQIASGIAFRGFLTNNIQNKPNFEYFI